MSGEVGLGVTLGLRGRGHTRSKTTAMTCGVAITVFLLLSLAAADHVVNGRFGRVVDRQPILAESSSPAFLVDASTDVWQGRAIDRVLVAQVGRGTRPPGVERIPAPGETVLSPALRSLLDDPGAESLRARYGQDVIGTIGQAGLAGPDELIAYVGVRPAELPSQGAVQASGFGTSSAAIGGLNDPRNGATQGVLVIGGLLIVMLCLFLGVSVRLSADTSDRQIAAMRLIGASAEQTRRVVSGEVLVATIGGSFIGLALFIALRPFAADLSFGAVRWFPGDFAAGIPSVVLVVLGVPILGHAIAQVGARRAVMEPFGVRRRSSVRLSTWWRVGIFSAGVALLAAAATPLSTVNGSERLAIVGFFAVSAAFPLALPIFVRWVASAIGARSRGLSTMLAARRLDHEPTAAGRVASSIGLAIIIVAVVGVIAANNAGAKADLVSPTDLATYRGLIRVDLPPRSTPPSLSTVHGVRAAIPLRMISIKPSVHGAPPQAIWVATCQQAALVLAVDVTMCGHSDAATMSSPEWVSQRVCGASGCRELPPISAGDTVMLADAMNSGVAITAPNATLSIPIPPHLLPEIGSAVIVIPASRVSPPAKVPVPNSWIVETDGSPATEQAVRSAIYADVPAATVQSLVSNVSIALADGAFARAVLTTGALLAIAVALVAALVAAMDATWQRRRQAGVLMAIGGTSRVLERSMALFLIIPVAVACLAGLGVSILIVAAYTRAASDPRELPAGLLPVTLLAVVVMAIASRILSRESGDPEAVAEAIRSE